MSAEKASPCWATWVVPALDPRWREGTRIVDVRSVRGRPFAYSFEYGHRATEEQEQAEFVVVTAGGPRLVAVRSFGGPDDVIPAVWLSPAR